MITYKLLYRKNIILFAVILSFLACKTEPKKDTATQGQDEKVSVVSTLRDSPDGLSPVQTTNGYTSKITNKIFLQLLDQDPQTKNLIPILAKSLPIEEDIESGPYAGGKSYTYEILDEAVWDNGTPVTGQDYLFTIKATLCPKAAMPAYRAYDFIKDVKLYPENPKKFTVMIPVNYLLQLEGSGDFSIYPEYFYDPDKVLRNYQLSDLANFERANELVEKDEKLQNFAASFSDPKHKYDPAFISGCGPYKVKSYSTETNTITLSKKENWWGNKLSNRIEYLTAIPNEIVFKTISDINVALSQLRAGQVDVVESIPPDMFAELKENTLAKDILNFHEVPSFILSYIGFNTKNKILSDKSVRKAIAHLIDRDDIMETVLKGSAQKAIGPIHPSSIYFNNNLKAIEYSPEKAANLLKEAGWEDSNGNGILDKVINGKKVEFELDFLYAETPTGTYISTLLANIAKTKGIKFNFVAKDLRGIITDLRARNYGLFSLGSAGSPGRVDLSGTYHSDSDTDRGRNYLSYRNSEVDEMLTQLSKTTDEATIKRLLPLVSEKIYNDLPIFHLWVPNICVATNKRFKKTLVSPIRPNVFENHFGTN